MKMPVTLGDIPEGVGGKAHRFDCETLRLCTAPPEGQPSV